jgi:hypothetical protein
MIMSAIFIEMFFSTSGACALANAGEASTNAVTARSLHFGDVVYLCCRAGRTGG